MTGANSESLRTHSCISSISCAPCVSMTGSVMRAHCGADWRLEGKEHVVTIRLDEAPFSIGTWKKEIFSRSREAIAVID